VEKPHGSQRPGALPPVAHEWPDLEMVIAPFLPLDRSSCL